MISFEAIEEKNKNATYLLRLWAFLDNRELWHGLLEAATDDPEQWPRWLCEIASNQANFLRAVSLLLRYSMIESQESMPPRYALHPVMHRWTSHIQSVREGGISPTCGSGNRVIGAQQYDQRLLDASKLASPACREVLVVDKEDLKGWMDF